ncbi:bifunctional Domain of unknown function DUF676 [Babesia duncani]|uniref:DUF676 domain-containing protein n=1 Tax=Babesia duncani TaxID=323732 RepID=A0AAD9PIF0_9APIC|nr:bifunctional Domain of unknown function DUF676 [Babesia duncani]
MYTELDIAIQLDTVSGVKFHGDNTDNIWHWVEFQVFTETFNGTLAAVPYKLIQEIEYNPNDAASTEVFGSPGEIATENNRMRSKSFKGVDNGRFSVDLKELMHFKLTLPGSLSLLDDLAIFVECSMYSKHISENGEVYGVDYVNSKVARVGHITNGLHEYMETFIEKHKKDASVHYMVHCSVLSFQSMEERYEHASYYPSPDYRYWENMLKKSSNKFLYTWYIGAKSQFANFYSRNTRNGDHSDNHLNVEQLPSDEYSTALVKDHLGFVTGRREFGGVRLGRTITDEDVKALQSIITYSALLSDRQGLEFFLKSLYFLYARILYINALESSLWIMQDCTSEKATVCDEANLKLIQCKGVVEFKDGDFVCLSESNAAARNSVFTSQLACNTQLCSLLTDRLDRIMKEFGISASGDGDVYISLPNGLQVKMKSLPPFNGDIKNYLVQMQEALSGESTIFKTNWHILMQIRVGAGISKFNGAFWKSRIELLNRVVHPAFTMEELKGEMYSWRISDEHLFFLVDSFPLLRLHGEAPKAKLEVDDFSEHMIIFVHSYDVDPWCFTPYVSSLKKIFGNHTCKFAKSNYNLFDLSMDEMGKRLAEEVKGFVNTSPTKIRQLSFVGHGIGGVVIRSAIRYLGEFKDMFYAMITMASPHLGSAHGNYTFANLIIRLYAFARKSKSLAEVTSSDSKNFKESLLYRLSLDDNISLFKVIRLIGVLGDRQVHACSSLVSPKSISNLNRVHEMATNLLSRMKISHLDRITLDYGNGKRYVNGLVWLMGSNEFIDSRLITRYLLMLMSDILS